MTTYRVSAEHLVIAWPEGMDVLIAARGSQRQEKASGAQVVREGERGTIPVGQRNERLTALAGAMRRQGATPEVLEAAVLEANARQCATPLPVAEVVGIAASVGRYAPKPSTAGSGNGSGPVIEKSEPHTELWNADRLVA